MSKTTRLEKLEKIKKAEEPMKIHVHLFSSEEELDAARAALGPNDTLIIVREQEQPSSK